MADEWQSLDSLGFSMYEANRNGNIRRKSNQRPLKLKPHQSNYARLCIKHDSGIYKTLKADGLICALFIGPPTHNAEVIHINGNPLDSRVENLKWGTVTEKKHVDTARYSTTEYIGAITLPCEEWRDCSPYGYTDYLASSLGRIYSMKTGKVLMGHIQADEYPKVTLFIDGNVKSTTIHTLVCYAFHGDPPTETHTVDHIDRNKLNNVPSNLRWASRSEQRLNQGKYLVRELLIAQIHDNKIVDFHDEQAILEIFDMERVVIPPEGIYFADHLWIYQNRTNLDMVGEIWMPIRLGDTIRMISNMGRIQMTTRKTFGTTRTNGYKSITIDGHPWLIHRLVITAFRGPIGPELVVNHIDGDRANNRLDNLEAITQSDNIIHAFNLGHKTLKPVQQIAVDGSIIATFPSIQAASDATGIYHSSISMVANGRNKTSGGFSWRFAN
jgi:hypothetical protein